MQAAYTYRAAGKDGAVPALVSYSHFSPQMISWESQAYEDMNPELRLGDCLLEEELECSGRKDKIMLVCSFK